MTVADEVASALKEAARSMRTQDKTAELQEQLQAARVENQELEKRIRTQAERRLDEMHGQLTAARTEVATLQQQLAAAQEEADERVRAAEDKCQQYLTSQQEIALQVQDMVPREEYAKLLAKVERMEATYGDMDKERKRALARVEELETQ